MWKCYQLTLTLIPFFWSHLVQLSKFLFKKSYSRTGVLFKIRGGGGEVGEIINKMLGSTPKSIPLSFCIPFLTANGALSCTFHVIYQKQVQGLHRGIQTLRNRGKHVVLLFRVYRCWLVGLSYEFLMYLRKTNETSLTCQNFYTTSLLTTVNLLSNKSPESTM